MRSIRRIDVRAVRSLALAAFSAVLAVIAIATVTTAGATVVIGLAQPQPGFALLSDNTFDGRTSLIDCPAPGDCVAVGIYSVSNYPRAWGATMSGGVWSNAVQLPGVSTIDTYPSVHFAALSCGAIGECLAGGYVRSSGLLSGFDAFVIRMTGGVWQNAQLVSGVAAGSNVNSTVVGIDCAAATNCAIVGIADARIFTADMSSGIVSSAVSVDGLDPAVESQNPYVSCPSVDFCLLLGQRGPYPGRVLFSATQVAGTWSSATDVPGAAALDTGQKINPSALACVVPGECVATGTLGTTTADVTFIATMTGGVFGDVSLLPVSSTIATSPFTTPMQIACPAAGDCVVTGLYYDATWKPYLYLAMQSNGVWSDAADVPGLTSVQRLGIEPQFTGLSCSAVGACLAVGVMLPSSPDTVAFVVPISSGVIGNAQELPGMATLQTGPKSSATTVSCTSDGACVGGGSYMVAGSNSTRAFTISSTGLEPTPPPTTSTTAAPANSTTTGGGLPIDPIPTMSSIHDAAITPAFTG